ncbi:hypothetical protein FSW04_15100 [Baekduia soli]|uniref:Uncharacterized protein n=1 Tax=Baekduia soli TaxID=496014 RepID=A0A5B8U727_9ACTN|nr:hypothetical protein [Baekduia soli]QEC48767.1 hypothetical protein FSW04_15100 [Baekduia soli]
MPARPALLLVAVLALAAPARASAQWSDPQDLSGPGTASAIITAAYDADGDGLLVWSAQPGPFYGTATHAAGTTGWQPGPRLLRGLAYLHAQPALAFYGRSRLLMRGSLREGSGPTLRYRMIAALGRADATFAVPVSLDLGTTGGRRAARSLSTPALAASPAGAAIAAWSRDDGTTTVVRVSERRAGASFGPVRDRTPQGARMPAVAIDARGDRVLAWYRRGAVQARVRPAGGAWGPVLRVAAAVHTPSVLRAAMDARGRILLAWATAGRPANGPTSFAFDAAVRLPGRPFTHRVLARYEATGYAFAGADRRIFTVLDAAGHGAIAWQGDNAGETAVVLARLGNRDRLATPHTLARGTAGRAVRPTELTIGPGGRLAVAWERETGDVLVRSEVVVAATTPGSGFLTPAQTLPATCPAPALCVVGEARAAFDPVTGALSAAWLQRDDANYRVWASSRPAS